MGSSLVVTSGRPSDPRSIKVILTGQYRRALWAVGRSREGGGDKRRCSLINRV